MALTAAVSANDLAAVKRVLASGGDVDERCDGVLCAGWRQELQRTTPLMLACSKVAGDTNLAIIRLLLTKHANRNAACQQGYTALHLACIHLHIHAIELLLAADVITNLADFQGGSPLNAACAHTGTAVMKMLLKHHANVNFCPLKGRPPLIMACSMSNTAAVRLLVEHGANVNFKTEQGMTALMTSSRRQSAEAALILPAAGADVNAADIDERTPLHYACSGAGQSALTMVQILLAAGAKTTGGSQIKLLGDLVQDNEVQGQICAALTKAASAGSEATHPNQSVRVLHYACQHGFRAPVEMLIAAGVDVTAQDCQGYTALIFAALHNHLEIVRTLLGIVPRHDQVLDGGSRRPFDIWSLIKSWLQGNSMSSGSVPASQEHLLGSLHAGIIGQEVALTEISRALHEYNTGWHSNRKPLVLLLTGPSRSGKTETAEQIARVLTGHPLDKRFFLNMGQFAQEHEVSRLNGAPPGFKGSANGELAILAESKHQIVVLDEMEKAHESVRQFFLGVFDRGQFRAQSGSVIDCKSVIFIMTSNIGHQLLKENASSITSLSADARSEFIHHQLEPLFLSAGWQQYFLNRIGVWAPFLPFTEQEQHEGALCFLQKAMACLPFVQINNMVISWSPAMVKEVAQAYARFPDQGFKAFERSEAFRTAKSELSREAMAEPSQGAIFYHVDFKAGKVVVASLLGQPPPHDKIKAAKVLQLLASALHQQQFGLSRQGSKEPDKPDKLWCFVVLCSFAITMVAVFRARGCGW